MTPKQIKDYYDLPEVLDHYIRATNRIGLWESEEKVFSETFKTGDHLLELGCGTGRITFGLKDLGYERMVGVDLSESMVREAKEIAEVLELRMDFQVGDAASLAFEDECFDGVIFGFNGLMQIPGAKRREKALREIHRVLKKGGHFVLTTHDRSYAKYQKFWKEEALRWERGEQLSILEEFGDRYADFHGHGYQFVHVPDCEQFRQTLIENGFSVKWTQMRGQIAIESEAVQDFSDECRFWVTEKSL